VHGSGLAYVIYTSGSTGRPKAAMNTFEGIRNRLLWMQTEYGLTPEDAVLQKTPYSFDVSVWELFWPLCVGARLVLARPEGHKDPRYIEDVCRRKAITTAHFVPSMLRLYLESSREVPALRRVVCSGEALTEAHVEAFDRVQPSTALYNLYGPTEAAVDVSATSRLAVGAEVTIGRAVANTDLRVVDDALQMISEGETGEICIAGIQVGRGYFGRADLTAEKFVPDPNGEPGARMYRTGDLGRSIDGEIHYLGRRDTQVKVRGHRIELGEIESVLRQMPGVRDAVVVARRSGTDDTSLVAYVCVQPGQSVDALSLREILRQKLPLAMVPSVVMALESFPLTPSGKIDRAALPDPVSHASQRPSPKHDVVFTPIERELADIWCDLLDVDEIAPSDDFFWLGGHSIMAVQMLIRAGKTFDVELPFDVLFATEATIAAIADRVAFLVATGASSDAFDRAHAWVSKFSEEDARVLLQDWVHGESAVSRAS
ncbi:MAG: non-ribosomal peptide synthetase, partial [Polyangiaceae bacterium]